METIGLGIGIAAVAIACAIWGIVDSILKSRSASAEQLEETRRHTALLSSENEQLTGKLGRLEERVAVLERIATDPARRTAEEIESLRV